MANAIPVNKPAIVDPKSAQEPEQKVEAPQEDTAQVDAEQMALFKRLQADAEQRDAAERTVAQTGVSMYKVPGGLPVQSHQATREDF